MPPPSTARISLPDRYRVVRHLANGGMASVWEAHDELLDRNVAVKILATHLSEDDRARRRFGREARAAAGLSSHPNVVTIYDVGEHDDRVFMVMELMRGGSVADRLRSGRERSGDEREARGRIPRETVLDWLHEAAAALDAAHEATIVHRDIKPANLLLDERDRLAMADFGIARIAQEEQLTLTGQVLGTASYISPEQAVGEPAVAASDRYSLAVVAYELLTGSRPFRGEHFAAQARAHVEDAPDPPSTRNPALPAALDAVLLRGLDKEPSVRWPSAGDMVRRIEDALERAPATAPMAPEPTRRLEPVTATPSRGSATPPPTPPSRRSARPVPAPAPGRRRRTGGLALLGGLAAVALLAALAFALLPGGNDRNRLRAGAQPTATATPRPKKQKKKSQATPTPTPTATASAAPPQSSAGTGSLQQATQFQLAGYNARRAGDYAKAIRFSQRALEACGSSGPLSPCGYAAYEMGYSLNHSGRAAEAIPFLERRLAYGDNSEASAELADARRNAAGGSSSGSSGSHGNSRKHGRGDNNQNEG